MNTIDNLWTIVLTISIAFYGIYTTYYFSVKATLGDLRTIRNHKIKTMILDVMKEKQTNSIDLFFLVDNLNFDNKVWLLEPDTDDSQTKFSLWLLGIVSIFNILFFMFRKLLLVENLVLSFNYIDLIFIALFVGSLTWAVFTLYWDFVYYRPFLTHKQQMNKDIPEVFEVKIKQNI